MQPILLLVYTRRYHVNKKRLFGYGIIGVISLMVAFTRLVSNLNEPGVDVWSGLISILSGLFVLSASFIFIFWSLLGSPTLAAKCPPMDIGWKRFVRTYTIIPAFLILIIVGNSLDAVKERLQTKQLGFATVHDMNDAKNNNIFSLVEYQKFLAQRELEKQHLAEQKAQDEAVAAQKKAAEEAKCNDDVWCYINHHENASFSCATLIPKLAKYKFEWNDGALEQKFDMARWINKSNHIVETSGTHATAQNGFGALQNISYYCQFNAETGNILNYGFN